MSDLEGKVIALPSVQQIESEAAAWLTVLGREHVSDEDRAEFTRWLRQSERHRSTFDGLRALWDDLGVLNELNDIGEAMSRTPVPRVPILRRGWFIAAAASLLVAIGIAGAFHVHYARRLDQTAAFATAVGEQRSIELSDGSVIQLNTDTEVQVMYSSAKRVVQLTRGEARFDVAKDRRRTFSVNAGSSEVKAVGTVFTVRRRDKGAVEVTVEEGTVTLESLPASGAATVGSGSTDPAPLPKLTAGQSTVFEERVETIRQLTEPELNRKLAWRQGVLVYSGEPLSEVIAEVSRYTDLQIEIADPALAGKPVAGYFPVAKIEGLLQSLQLNFGIRVERVDDSHVRLSSS